MFLKIILLNKCSPAFSKSGSAKGNKKYNRNANDRIVKRRASTVSNSSRDREELTHSPIPEEEKEDLFESASSEKEFQNPLKSGSAEAGSRPSTQWRLSQSLNQLMLEEEMKSRSKLEKIESYYKNSSRKGKQKSRR